MKNRLCIIVILFSILCAVVYSHECSCDFETDVCGFEPINQTDSWQWSATKGPESNISYDGAVLWTEGSPTSHVNLLSPLLTNITEETEFSFDIYCSSTANISVIFVPDNDGDNSTLWTPGIDELDLWLHVITDCSNEYVNCCQPAFPCNGRIVIDFHGSIDNDSFVGFDNFTSTDGCDSETNSSTPASPTTTLSSISEPDTSPESSSQTTSSVTASYPETTPTTASSTTLITTSLQPETTSKETSATESLPTSSPDEFTSYEIAVIVLMSVATAIAVITAILVILRFCGCRVSSRRNSFGVTSISK